MEKKIIDLDTVREYLNDEVEFKIGDWTFKKFPTHSLQNIEAKKNDGITIERWDFNKFWNYLIDLNNNNEITLKS